MFSLLAFLLELLNKHFCKNKISAFPIISLWKISVAIATKAVGH